MCAQPNHSPRPVRDRQLRKPQRLTPRGLLHVAVRLGRCARGADAWSLVMFSLGLVYGPIYPLGYLLASIGLLIKFIGTRFGLRHWYAKPPSVDQEMTLSMRWRLGQMLGLGLVIQCVALNESTGPGTAARARPRPSWLRVSERPTQRASPARAAGNFGPSSIVFLGGSILLICYTVAPLHMFKSMARFDQLEDLHDTDTGGVTFQDASGANPVLCARYVCPKIGALDPDDTKDTTPRGMIGSLTKQLSSRFGRASSQVGVVPLAQGKGGTICLKAILRTAEILSDYGLEESAPAPPLAPEASSKDDHV